MNFSYALRPDRQSVVLAMAEESSMWSITTVKSLSIPITRKRNETTQLITEVIRRPDGVLFDYVRIPRFRKRSVVNKVQDLWIYSNAAKQAFINVRSTTKGLN